MTQTSPIGRHAAGTKRELTIMATEAALDKPKRLPASRLLNDIARDALAAVFRDDALAIANLPTAVRFRAFVVQSKHPGYWCLVITTKAHGAWGHCKSGALANHATVVALAEMINGPDLTNPVKPTPSVARSTCADRLGVLAALYDVLFGRHTARAAQPSAAAGSPNDLLVKTTSAKANTAAGSLNCASLPAAP